MFNCFDISFDIVAVTGKIVAKDFVERIVRLVAFDNVASSLLLVWTGLLRQSAQVVPAQIQGGI